MWPPRRTGRVIRTGRRGWPRTGRGGRPGGGRPRPLTWLAAVLDDCGGWDHGDGAGEARARLAGTIADLVGAWRQTSAYVVAVSDETGLGVVPATPAGRLFRDELGRLNQALAAESEEAELVVAGRVLPLDAW